MGVSILIDGSRETSLGLSNFFLDGVILKKYISSPSEVKRWYEDKVCTLCSWVYLFMNNELDNLKFVKTCKFEDKVCKLLLMSPLSYKAHHFLPIFFMDAIPIKFDSEQSLVLTTKLSH